MSLDAIDRVDVSRRAFLAGLVAGSPAAALGEGHLVLAQTGTTAAPTRSAPGTRMGEGRPSITAQWAANLRAAHQLFDEPKVLNDPLALRIIGKDAASELRTRPLQFQVVPTLRAVVVLRSRYAEDELARALERGVRHYVILGAGLDTVAYRTTPPDSGFRVFEADHPATQVWKRARLQEAGIAVPKPWSLPPSTSKNRRFSKAWPRQDSGRTGRPVTGLRSAPSLVERGLCELQGDAGFLLR
jgi:hypothetical protein